ncbi:hypothetical protein ABKN59_006809 [Abortiporus biennis]
MASIKGDRETMDCHMKNDRHCETCVRARRYKKNPRSPLSGCFSRSTTSSALQLQEVLNSALVKNEEIRQLRNIP